jgi:7,8-dihydro-6-hydroxymethylpterin-pyrophosphokinase
VFIVIDEGEELQIPHIRLDEREFVLAPLMNLGVSELLHPKLNRTVGELYEQLMQRERLGPSGVRLSRVVAYSI